MQNQITRVSAINSHNNSCYTQRNYETNNRNLKVCHASPYHDLYKQQEYLNNEKSCQLNHRAYNYNPCCSRVTAKENREIERIDMFPWLTRLINICCKPDPFCKYNKFNHNQIRSEPRVKVESVCLDCGNVLGARKIPNAMLFANSTVPAFSCDTKYYINDYEKNNQAKYKNYETWEILDTKEPKTNFEPIPIIEVKQIKCFEKAAQPHTYNEDAFQKLPMFN